MYKNNNKTTLLIVSICLVVLITISFSYLTLVKNPIRKGANQNSTIKQEIPTNTSPVVISTKLDNTNGIQNSYLNNNSSNQDNSTSGLLKNMTLTFDDEFNTFSRYTDLNGNITCNAGGKGTWQTVYYFCSRTITSNNEAEIYIDQNFLDYLNTHSTTPSQSVSPFNINNGVLDIVASPSDSSIQSGVGQWAKFTSGLITTQFSFSQKYGYFEIRTKLPEGKGLWPAFWLLPIDKSWPPEIDVLEAFGGPNTKNEGGHTMIHYASHTTNKNESCGAWYNTHIDITNNFHTYGVDIEPTGITYYFDGNPYAHCLPNSETNKPFYMLINLAVGGNGSWPGTPDSSNIWPAHMYIDYVRAYQKNSN